MKNIRNLLIIILFLSTSGLHLLDAQQVSLPGSVIALEQQYEEFITGALRFQVKADSLSRLANQKRRELAFIDDDSRRKELESRVLKLEDDSYNMQKQADGLYSKARAVELRIMAGHKESDKDSLPSVVNDVPALKIRDQEHSDIFPGMANTDFLKLGGEDISVSLSARELALAEEIESDYCKANQLMAEVSDINNEIEQLGNLLDLDPPRRERRRINRMIDELSAQAFDNKMEAMLTYEKVNLLRYTAAVSFLEEKRKQLNDSLIIGSGLVHEELARESFTQAAGLRETAEDMLSDKYLEGFILRAYTEELKAFNELEKAIEIYSTPAVALQEEKKELPLKAEEQIDTGLAISGVRLADKDLEPYNGQSSELKDSRHMGSFADYGFQVLSVSPYSADNPVPVNAALPKGIAYRIQLGIFTAPMTPVSFGGLYPVMSEKETGSRSIHYFTGIFRTLNEAEKALLEVNRQGFSDAFIVAYNDGTKIPANRARQIEQRRQSADIPSGEADILSGQPESLPPASLRPTEEPGIIIFKIQLGVFRELLQSSVYRSWQNMAGNKNIEYVRNNNGLYVYSIGNFNTFEEAVEIRNLFRTQEVPDAFVVPYKGDRRISIEEANQLLHGR